MQKRHWRRDQPLILKTRVSGLVILWPLPWLPAHLLLLCALLLASDGFIPLSLRVVKSDCNALRVALLQRYFEFALITEKLK